MKTIVSALVALSVLSGVAGSVLEASAFWEEDQCYSFINRPHLNECTLN